jgi:hypothetical protein
MQTGRLALSELLHLLHLLTGVLRQCLRVLNVN